MISIKPGLFYLDEKSKKGNYTIYISRFVYILFTYLCYDAIHDCLLHNSFNQTYLHPTFSPLDSVPRPAIHLNRLHTPTNYVLSTPLFSISPHQISNFQLQHFFRTFSSFNLFSCQNTFYTAALYFNLLKFLI